MKIGQEEFFVWSMHAIVREGKAHQDGVDSKYLRKSIHHRNRAAGRQKHGLGAKSLAIGPGRGANAGMFATEQHGFIAGQDAHAYGQGPRSNLGQEAAQFFRNLRRILIGDQAKTQLRAGTRWNNSLPAGALITGGYSVDRERRTDSGALEKRKAR